MGEVLGGSRKHGATRVAWANMKGMLSGRKGYKFNVMYLLCELSETECKHFSTSGYMKVHVLEGQVHQAKSYISRFHLSSEQRYEQLSA